MRTLILLFSAFAGAALPHPALGADSAEKILQKGLSEWGIQAGGGLAVAGGVQNKSYMMIIGRWGRILTGTVGKGPFKGNLQYSAEIIPVMIMSQSSLVYAGGLSPLQLRYNFTSSPRLVPFFEIGGAVLASQKEIPERTSRINFLTFGGLGVHFLRAQNRDIQLGMRFQHISNAGLTDLNPGINSLYFFLGLSRFR